MSYHCEGCRFTKNTDRIHGLLHSNYVNPGEPLRLGETITTSETLQRKIVEIFRDEETDLPDAIRVLITLAIDVCDMHDQQVKEASITHVERIQ